MKLKTKYIYIFIISIISTLFILLNIVDVSAHDAYFLGITFDEGSCQYIGNVAKEKVGMKGKNHAEISISVKFHLISEGTKVPVIDYSSATAESIESSYSKFIDTDYDDNSIPLLFTFPSFHTKGVLTTAIDATNQDSLLADRVVSVLIPQLNGAVDWIIDETGAERSSTSFREIATSLVNIAQTAYGNSHKTQTRGSGSFNVTSSQGGTVAVTVNANLSSLPSDISTNMTAGIGVDDYVSIKINNKTNYFIYQCWKGYNYPTKADKQSDPLARDVSSGDYYENEGKKDVYKIGWNAIVLQGNYNFDVKGINFASLGEIMPSNALINGIAELCEWVISGIRSFLGLYSIEECMLNRGTRGSTYSMGLFPKGWTAAIYLTHIICQMIAWGCMGFVVLKILIQKQLSTVNIGEKVAVMNELKNLAICGFLLGSFPLIFNMAARFNISLVNLFAVSTQYSTVIGKFATLSQASFGSIVAAFFELGITIYFNFFYVLRAITLAILYGIAPLAIYTLALGGKYSKVYGAFSKELYSNIFVQTIHAIMIAFFASVSGTTGLKNFETLIVLYSFIPLTKFVKQNVFQMSEGVTGLAAGLAGGLGSGIGGIGNVRRNITDGDGAGTSKAKGHSGGSGSNSYIGSGGTGVMADRMANNRNPKPANSISMKDDDQIGTRESKASKRAAKQVSANPETVPKTLHSSIDGNMFKNDDVKDKTLMNTKGQGMGGSYFRNAARNGAEIAYGLGVGAMKGGLGLAISSFDPKAGNKLISESTNDSLGNITRGIGNIKNGVLQDRNMVREAQTYGVESVKSNGQYDFIETSVKAGKLEDGPIELGSCPPNMNPMIYDSMSNMVRALDPKSDMNDDERAYYKNKAAASDKSFAIINDKLHVRVSKQMSSKQPNMNVIQYAMSPVAKYIPKKEPEREAYTGETQDLSKVDTKKATQASQKNTSQTDTTQSTSASTNDNTNTSSNTNTNQGTRKQVNGVYGSERLDSNSVNYQDEFKASKEDIDRYRRE